MKGSNHHFDIGECYSYCMSCNNKIGMDVTVKKQSHFKEGDRKVNFLIVSNVEDQIYCPFHQAL